jgi:formylglycine-generating enzyme required for sulfatase activity
VRAGLLPRLPKGITAVYIEATAQETQTRLLKNLRRQVADLTADLGLVESLAALRRGKFLPSGQKILLVLDQFEQWLHAKRSEQNTELVQALRHCDGGRVQCLVMVRDDFWLAVSRFMKAIEVEIVEGHNSALVDLFDPLHARKVLTAFGRAYGRLPDQLGECTKDQEFFLDQAIAGLSQYGKVVSVRLALFAEMVKGKPWKPVTLKEVGGMEGVGVTFLEETFAASTAPPQHRLHQKAAQAVLKALLPETGTDIKGNMRSQQQLLEASGYADRPRDFSKLLHVLDGELRLITPTDPEGVVDGRGDKSPGLSGEPQPTSEDGRDQENRYYQLTHDYLVPSLRAWLTRKQKETRRGRAELRLAERSALWSSKPQNRHLPAWWEWANIRLFTRKKHWTRSQTKMMRRAARYHALRGIGLAVMLALATLMALGIRGRIIEQNNATYAAGLVRSLLDATITQVPAITEDLANYRVWADPLLRQEYEQAPEGSRQKLQLSLALLPVDSGQAAYLYQRLLDAEPHEVPVIREALVAHKDQLLDQLWRVVEKPEKGKEQHRLRAAAALARYDTDSARWDHMAKSVADDLVSVPAVYLAAWLESLRPLRAKLLVPLAVVYRDGRRRETERSLATDTLADYAADEPELLAELLLDADKEQFLVLYPKFQGHAERALALLNAEMDKYLPPDASNDAKETLAKRQANAAVALLRMNQPNRVWPRLKHSPDPMVRSNLIHRFGPLGTDAAAIIKRLEEEPDVTIRRALILSLGLEEFGEAGWTPAEKTKLVAQLQQLYRTAADPGLHAAAEWLLRQWKEDAWLRQTDEECAKKQQRERRLKAIKAELAKGNGKPSPQWYINGQGQTMVVIPGPVEFMMGSPPGEENRRSDESQHTKRIRRTFALSAKPVTKEDFLRFRAKFSHSEFRRYPEPTCPIGGVLWYEAAAYCNWLSKQEGIPQEEWCYEPKTSRSAAFVASTTALLGSPSVPGALLSVSALIPGRSASGEYAEGMKLKADYLHKSGYRLPTESEMEYATRAGAVTSRYYGETAKLLEKYGWFWDNSKERTWPVGSKKPNDWGLFDMHGNVWTWCQERYRPYPEGEEGKVFEDTEDILPINNQDYRVLRGGSFTSLASNFRSAYRGGLLPTNRDDVVGFRPARTFTP